MPEEHVLQEYVPQEQVAVTHIAEAPIAEEHVAEAYVPESAAPEPEYAPMPPAQKKEIIVEEHVQPPEAWSARPLAATSPAVSARWCAASAMSAPSR